ncbi:IclR family transcriptional regulator [Acidovorax sp. NCPPB 2350]|nr:IclR family transcriptional regulator [Acidovorax sp. NCPPB 2350]
MEYTVAAVDEAVRLLFLVAENPGLGLSELGRRSANTKARTFRLLSTLEERNLVTRRGEPATYHLGFATLALGTAAQEQLDLLKLVEPALKSLSDRFDETVVVRIREGVESMSVARREPQRSLRVNGQIGARTPLYAGASSKLLLAFSSDELQKQVLEAERVRFTKSTLVSAKSLQKALDQIRAQDYCVSLGEHVEDIGAVAVPLRDSSGAVVAALSISAPAHRMTDKHVEAYLKEMKQEAARISREMGFRG